MPNQGNQVTTVVIELQPGWIFVKIAEPGFDANADRLEFLVHHTIDQWFAARPNAVIEKTERIPSQGEILGIHVWYRHEERTDVQSAKQGTPPDSFFIEVHNQVAETLPREHIEALVDSALKILPSYSTRPDSLVVISPRRIAVILEKQIARGAVLPAELIEQVISAQSLAKLQAWFKSPSTQFYVMHIEGNWFENSN